MNGPSEEWLLKMAEKDNCGCTSVGGLACELGLYKQKDEGRSVGPKPPKYRVGYNVILTKDIAASIGQPIGDIERHKIEEVIWEADWPEFSRAVYTVEDKEWHVHEYDLTTEDEVYDWAKSLVREIEGPNANRDE